jgi:mannose-1-phosphate guanylyltransferase
MKVILLAAGFGTRLRPLTKSIPKCLVPINGIPLLEIWLKNLTEVGLNLITVNTHYLSNQVNEFIKNSKYNNFVSISHEEILLGTAGTISKNISKEFDGDVMVIHSDNYCKIDFRSFIKSHLNRNKKCLMTMLAFRTENPKSCGIIQTNNNILTKFDEKPNDPMGNLANGAVYILTKEVIRLIKNNNLSDLSNDVIPKLVNKINVYENKGFFIDIGNNENYIKAQSIC